MARPFRTLHPVVDTLVAKRQHLGLTQQDVADRLALCRSSVAKFETNTRHSPQLATLDRYAAAVGMQIIAVTATESSIGELTPDG